MDKRKRKPKGKRKKDTNGARMPQQEVAPRGVQMGVPNQNIIDQEVLTRLLVQLPPDAGAYGANRVSQSVPASTYTNFQKPVGQNNYLFPPFQHHGGPMPNNAVNKSQYPMQNNSYNEIPTGYQPFSYAQQNKPFNMGSNTYGMKPGPPFSMPNATPTIPTRNTQERVQGARALRIPEDQEFTVKLDKPLIETLRKGGKELNALQLRKLKDATNLLQSMQAHKLQPLSLYTAAELFEIMASIAETWKNSGKAAWKKRINKIKENARGRKPPRNKLDKQEIAEIEKLQSLCARREEWEKREKEKIAAAKRKRLMGDDKSTPQIKFEKEKRRKVNQ